MRARSKRQRTGRGVALQAEQADRHALYQRSVQDPEAEVAQLDDLFRRLRGRSPLSLREDFCGTALLATQWCRSDPRRTAIGVDLCRDTLEWGRLHNVEPAGKEIASRIHLVQDNVLDVRTDPVDLVCGFNFSYNGLLDRASLRRWFENAASSLTEEGLLVLDCYGGSEAFDTVEEERDIEGEFTFVWEQASFNPIDHRAECHIHFRFPDGSALERAFSYRWRIWTLPEIRDLLAEAGFSSIHVFWEQFEEGEEEDEYLVSTGRYEEVAEAENQESWICYVAAAR